MVDFLRDQYKPANRRTDRQTYLGTQLGEERSTSQVAYRFMWTGRLEVMLTGLEGCKWGEGTPPVRGSPPRSDILLGRLQAKGAARLAWPPPARVVCCSCRLLPPLPPPLSLLPPLASPFRWISSRSLRFQRSSAAVQCGRVKRN